MPDISGVSLYIRRKTFFAVSFHSHSLCLFLNVIKIIETPVPATTLLAHIVLLNALAKTQTCPSFVLAVAGYPLRSTGYNIWFISDVTNFPEVERDCPYN
jgi:hypothetical protein